MFVNVAEEDYLWRRGMPWGGGEGGGYFNDDNLLKGMRSVSNVLCSCPLNDSLVSFVIIIITNELFPLMFYHSWFRWLINLHFLPW